MTQHYTETSVSLLAYTALGYSLRQQYQPAAVAAMANADCGAKKFIIGCGGGKTLMMSLGVALQIEDGAKKVVVTAPTIRLCRQLEYEFIDLFSKVADRGKIPHGITFFNVSSDGKQKSSDLDDDDIFEENFDDFEDAGDKKKPRGIDEEATLAAESFGATRTTSQDHDDIEDALTDGGITIFFVCKPSFLKNFRHRVSKVRQEVVGLENFEIDITCHDEFHNFISTNKKESCKSALYSYAEFSRNNWFFSASKRATERLTWLDKIFGDLVVDVPSSKLVDWGYLVPELKIFVVTASMISKIEDPVKQKFERMYNANASDFLREAKVVLKVLEHQKESSLAAPKMLHFSKRVAFTKEMASNTEFRSRVDSLLSDVALYQMDGSTRADARELVFEHMRETSDMGAYCVLQHSIFGQGINCPNFNVAIIARGMSYISMQQALGRIQRSYAGKKTAYLYIYVDDADYVNSMTTLAEFLHYGLGEFNVTVEKLVDDTSGSEDDDDDDNDDTNQANLSSVKTKLKDPNVIIQPHRLRLQEEDRLLQISEMSEEELNAACPF